jgi:hypothetical protein
LRIGIPLEEEGEYCTVKEVGLGVYSIILHTPWPQKAMEPTSFWGVVESWGETWLWDNLKTTGDIGWIAEARLLITSILLVLLGNYFFTGSTTVSNKNKPR